MKLKAKIKDIQLTVRAKASFGENILEQEVVMFAQKNLRGFMKPQIVRKGVLDYTGPVAVSLAERMKKPISAYDFFFVIEQVIEAVRKIQANSFVVSRMCIDINNVYINENTKEVQFIYLPVEGNGKKSNLISFIQSIIYSANPKSEKDQECIFKFTHFLNGLQGYDAGKIEKYIENFDAGIINIIKNAHTEQSGFITNKRNTYFEHYDRKAVQSEEDEGTIALSHMTDAYSDFEEGTMLLDDGYEDTALLEETEEETGLLEDNNLYWNKTIVVYPKLSRCRTGDTVEINKPVYRIGKERSYVDYFVSDNTKVSRSHADIIKNGDRYFIKDLGSKNKTYLNNRMIMPEQETEIVDGDIIRLADEEFIFNL